MPDMQPLAEKLQQADSQQLTALLANQTLKSYFSASGDILGDQCFDSACQNQKQEDETLVCQFLHQLPKDQKRARLLYQILVWPFEMMLIDDDEDNEEMEE